MENCGVLPATGTSVGIIIALAAVSVLGGGLLVRMTRRRGTLAAVLLIAMVVLAAAPARAASDCPTTTAPSIPATSAAAPSSLAPTTVPEPVSSTTIAPETTTTSMATTTSSTSTSTSTTTTVPLTPVLSVSFAPTFDPDYCLVIVNATGFPADSTVSGELRHTSDIDSAGPWPFSIPTDGSGSGSADLISYYQSDWNNQFNAVAGSLESGFTPISC